MLHVTNGHSVGLREAGLQGDVLVWLDPLHEGPVPAGLSLEELSKVRGEYLGVDLGPRDAQLRAALNGEIVLWFEHDLYDQLQLIQLLDFFRTHSPQQLWLIQTDRYLGHFEPSELALLWPQRELVTPEQLDQAAAAWAAFRAADPAALRHLNTTALPYLTSALARHLDEFPAAQDGLGRTDRQILIAVMTGAREFAEIFHTCQAMEEAIYMGDTSFRKHLDRMASARAPLLKALGDAWELTPAGEQVLAGEANDIELNGIDLWLGGVHLTDAGSRSA